MSIWDDLNPANWGKEIEKVAKDTYSVVVNGTEQAYDKTKKVVDDTGKVIVDVAKDTYNYSVSFALDSTYRAKDAAQYVSKNTEEFGKAGLDVTQKEFTQLSKQAEEQISRGVEVVKYGAEYAYNWLDENACRLGLTTAISMGFVAAFTPKPAPGDPGTVTATAATTTYAGMLAAGATNMAIAAAITELTIEPIWNIPGIKGSCDKSLLKNCVSNCIYYSLTTAPALWLSGAGFGIAMGAAVAPVIATYICTRTMPNGFSKFITDSNNQVNLTIDMFKVNCLSKVPYTWSKTAPKGAMYTSNMPPEGQVWMYGPNGERKGVNPNC